MEQCSLGVADVQSNVGTWCNGTYKVPMTMESHDKAVGIFPFKSRFFFPFQDFPIQVVIFFSQVENFHVEIFISSRDFFHVEMFISSGEFFSCRDFYLKSRICFSCRDFLSQVEIFCHVEMIQFSIQGESRDVTQDSMMAFPGKYKNDKMTWRSVVL